LLDPSAGSFGTKESRSARAIYPQPIAGSPPKAEVRAPSRSRPWSRPHRDGPSSFAPIPDRIPSARFAPVACRGPPATPPSAAGFSEDHRPAPRPRNQVSNPSPPAGARPLMAAASPDAASKVRACYLSCGSSALTFAPAPPTSLGCDSHIRSKSSTRPVANGGYRCVPPPKGTCAAACTLWLTVSCTEGYRNFRITSVW